ncbi:hypothetical protein L218DRAFT_159926 [Marasmius fiardii PR-910]|nr:hypothetical protein L218DRAFT_159926 [Marasmius fiardii PR-910]
MDAFRQPELSGLVPALRKALEDLRRETPNAHLKLVDEKSHRWKKEGTFEEENLGTYRHVPSLPELDQVARPARQANGAPTAATLPQTPKEYLKCHAGRLCPGGTLIDPDAVSEGRNYKLKPGFHVNLGVVQLGDGLES